MLTRKIKTSRPVVRKITATVLKRKISSYGRITPPVQVPPPVPAKVEKEMPMLPLSLNMGLQLGCDPELFLVHKDGSIIGSEKLIPKEGVIVSGKVVRDGVQVELNPDSRGCRQQLIGNIYGQINWLENAIATKFGKDVTISDAVTVRLSDTDMSNLSDEAKILGCNKSYNVYDETATVGVEDSTKFMSRSGGGHIHLGANQGSHLHDTLQNAKRLIPVLDTIVGNTCVLIDRDEGNVIRRQTYGRAGEFRLPNHGIEYRTLSNFWLRDAVLTSFVMGITRQAVRLVESSTEENDYAGKLMSLVDINDVRNAINNNDVVLAKKNFDKIKDFIIKHSHNSSEWNYETLSSRTIKQFEHFITKPIEYWFPRTMKDNWLIKYRNNSIGIESFLLGTVNLDVNKIQ